MLSFFTFRSSILLLSTAFSIVMVMLILGMTDTKELGLEGKSCVAVQTISNRSQEVIKNIAKASSVLLNEMFGGFSQNNDCDKDGSDDKKCGIDLTKFKINFLAVGNREDLLKRILKLEIKINRTEEEDKKLLELRKSLKLDHIAKCRAKLRDNPDKLCRSNSNYCKNSL